MTQIINSFTTYLNTIELLSGNEDLFLSTYGLAINDQIARILTKAKTFRIMVGIYERYCYPDCEHCRINISNNKLLIKQYQDEFGKERILGIDHLHKKIAIMGQHTMIGGFNLTDSEFTDNAMLVASPQLAQESSVLYMHQWNTLQQTILEGQGSDVVGFGKYRGKTFSEMHADIRYCEYMHGLMDERSFKEKMHL